MENGRCVENSSGKYLGDQKKRPGQARQKPRGSKLVSVEITVNDLNEKEVAH